MNLHEIDLSLLLNPYREFMLIRVGLTVPPSPHSTLNTISKVKNCTCEKFLCFFRNKAKLLSHVLNPHKKAKTLPPQKVKEDRKEEIVINKKETKRRVKKTHR